MTEIDVVNVIGWISYHQELELEALAEAFSERDEISEVKYEPGTNPWLQTYFEPNDIYVAFYRSGKCSIPGCGSIDHFEYISNKVNNVMKDLLDFSYEPKSEISNIVATADFGTSIPLERLALELGMDMVEYEPEQFPGLMYRDTEYVILVFASGKVLCTGLSDVDMIADAIKDIEPQIRKVM